MCIGIRGSFFVEQRRRMDDDLINVGYQLHFQRIVRLLFWREGVLVINVVTRIIVIYDLHCAGERWAPDVEYELADAMGSQFGGCVTHAFFFQPASQCAWPVNLRQPAAM